jgi:hemerythrin-like metal-binding protein
MDIFFRPIEEVSKSLYDWIFKKKKDDLRLEWDSKYSVGIIEIDAQHKKLFAVYNDFVDVIYREGGTEDLQKSLDALLEYVILHFSAEEGYMQKYAYEGFEAHKAEHKALREKTYYLHKDFSAGKPVLTMDVLLFLKNWISEHVLGVDMKYRDFLVSKLPAKYLA